MLKLFLGLWYHIVPFIKTNSSIMFLLKKLKCFIKIVDIIKYWSVPAKQFGLKDNDYDCYTHNSKSVREKSCSYAQSKTSIMLWFDDWDEAWWKGAHFCCGWWFETFGIVPLPFWTCVCMVGYNTPDSHPYLMEDDLKL